MTFHDELSLVLGGEAGQGIKTIEDVLVSVLKRAGYGVFSTKELMSRIRGGSNSTEIRIASERRAAFVSRIDVLVPLDKEAIPHLAHRISDQTVIVGEKAILDTDRPVVDVPFTKIASEAGSKLAANTVAAGAVLGLLGVDFVLLADYLRTRFAAKGDAVIGQNLEAGKRGYAEGRALRESGNVTVNISPNPEFRKDMLAGGAEAVGMGAAAGGCNFIASYPMSPSTGVLVWLASHARELGIVAEQAEDEIAAINMALGAWYAGARGMVTTSGGGFALMTEGLSLAGITETPVVIHLAQRPGPATGLPTRTEQGDLELALYGGHGEFPRILLAPGDIEEAFDLSARAFDLADRFQVPVILLTDQYLMDSTANVPAFDVDKVKVERHIVETTPAYKRYALKAEEGVSPRGIPGWGEGLVLADSDEHDEEGRITESMAVRNAQNGKRLGKLEGLRRAVIPPVLVGPEGYKRLVVGWGSTYRMIAEAVDTLGRDDTAYLHFRQVYPLPDGLEELLAKAEQTVLVEGNATGQLGKLIRRETGHAFDAKLLKSDGLAFSVEEVRAGLEEVLS